MALPVVLAGPILRRVAGDSVSVWIALRDAAQVDLTVWAGPQRSTGPRAVEGNAPVVASGTVSTRPFGANLHVAVVTAKAEGTVIAPGTIHSYDVTIDNQNLLTLKLLEDEKAESRLPGVDPSAPLHLALGFELDRLPSFATPAAVLTDLCLAHASCRRTNHDSPEATAYLDDIVKDNRTDIAGRPQQLFLTGDQIYADDLGDCLLRQINEIGRELLGFTETLPIDNNNVNVDTTEFPPMRRRHLVREIGRFTTSDGMSHLLSYGEFVALHLLSWSPRLWRPLDPPEAVFVLSPKVAANHLQDWEAEFAEVDDPTESDPTKKWKKARQGSTSPKRGYLGEMENVKVFAAALPRVARALANIPTYMIFDDHEVTDDWYLSQSWRSRVVTAPFGRAVVRNAYMAYALCQAWGNDPAGFSHEGAAPKPKNEELLDALQAVGTERAISPATIAKLEPLLGLVEAGKDTQVSFHYSVPGPRHLVRVLDTLTKRTFKGRLGPPKLLGGSLDAQLPAGPLTDGRELLVVVSPNPVLMPRIFDTLIQPLAAKIGDFKANVKEKAKGDLNGPPITGNEGRDVEGWGMDEDTLETMIQRLGTYTKAIILSGDVHFSSSLALDFWNGADPTVDSRIVQLTSSGSRNIAPGNLRAAIRAARFSQQLLRGIPFERLAWKQKAPIVVPSGGKISPARRSRMRRTPSLLPATGWPAGTTVPADKPPDWRWRLTGLRDDTPRAQTVRPDRQPPELPDFNPSAAMESYNQIAAKHVELALSTTELLRLLVFRTNIGVVRFETVGAEQFVVHELWSTDGPNSTEGAPMTRHQTSLTAVPTLDPPQLEVVADA